MVRKLEFVVEFVVTIYVLCGTYDVFNQTDQYKHIIKYKFVTIQANTITLHVKGDVLFFVKDNGVKSKTIHMWDLCFNNIINLLTSFILSSA